MTAPPVSAPPHAPPRSRHDLCPGVLRPWPAADGALVRLRLVGGGISSSALTALLDVAEAYGDGAVHLTGRANLQLRALPLVDDVLAAPVVEAITATGLLPAPSHELVRNVMVSPLSGLLGGRADLRPVAAELDARICADPALAGLSGRFLFVLDDGRGDLLHRSCDLGLVALTASTAQLRVGTQAWGPVVPLAGAAEHLVALAGAFVAARGAGPTAPWHVDELDAPLTGTAACDRDPRTRVSSPPPAYGPLDGADRADGRWRHVEVPGGVLTRPVLTAIGLDPAPAHLVVTPWHGLVVAVR